MDTHSDDSSVSYLDTVEGEISFFRSLMRSRPVGLHRHFHALSMRTAIYHDTGHYVSVDDIWEKLRGCYDLEAIETLEAEDYESPSSGSSTPRVVASPSPSQNLAAHPHFRKEFALPWDETVDAIMQTRRARGSASPPSPTSPSAPPPRATKGGGTRGRKRGRSKAKRNAGLVGGDSDSSALTQESGDEAVPTPRESVVTMTDGEYGEDEDVEMGESPAPSASARPTRGRGSRGKRGGRGRAAAVASTRGVKRRKR
ncbi:hypothetical protein FA95DRAFT_1532662 [Auriscalpium vulgare]|uniref:Uncharacterized protein n=1 Tax=Auriscalpium vulgare TaxID=40419 RepID=A0ACB8S8A1_9AGAM|nr:hypothetical protein FA95DRAFT_1532662 [Auriscalpium vulgare]